MLSETRKAGAAALVATLLATVALSAGSASAALPRHQEAELAPDFSFGSRHYDAGATPGVAPNSWRFVTGGTIRHFFTVQSGEAGQSVVVRAKLGGSSPSSVSLGVTVNGTPLGIKTLSSAGRFAEQTYLANIRPGTYHVDIAASDMQTGDKLIYDWVEIRGSGGGTPTTSAFIVGAGDISSGSNRDNQTGDLVRQQLAAGAYSAFTTGDNAYPDGTHPDYKGFYNDAWGSFKAKTRPVFGNHDYHADPNAGGASSYWNEYPAVPVPGGFTNQNSYYAYNVGASNWRGIVLNSQYTEGPQNQAPECASGSAQHNFLVSELASARRNNKNTVLFWHHPRFSRSGDHPTPEGATGCSKFFWDRAHDGGADLVLQGHGHLYERYDARDRNGNKTAGGLTEIVCGTGGNSFDSIDASVSPAPDNIFTNAWGVCKLTLEAQQARVSFLPAAGSPGFDSATVPVRP
jgi:hypothetical protein